MSRTYIVQRHTFKKVPEKDRGYKCDCMYCLDSKLRYQRVGEDLLKAGLKEEFEDTYRYRPIHVRVSQPFAKNNKELESLLIGPYVAPVDTAKVISYYSQRGLNKLLRQCGIGGIGSTHGV